MLSWGRATILPFCPGLLSGPGGWCWHMSGRLSLPDPRILSANSRDQARCKRIRKLRTKKVSTCFHSKIDLGGEMYGNVDVWTHFCIPPKNSVHCVDPSQTHGCQSHEIAYKSMHSSWQSTLCQWTFDHWINLGPKLDKPPSCSTGSISGKPYWGCETPEMKAAYPVLPFPRATLDISLPGLTT